MHATHDHPSYACFEIYSVSDGKNCELTCWAIHPNNFWSWECGWSIVTDFVLKWNYFKKFAINIWNKYHLIKWLKMQQYDIKKGCDKTFWDIKRNCITYLNLKILILWLCPTVTSDTNFFLKLRVNKLLWYTKVCTFK